MKKIDLSRYKLLYLYRKTLKKYLHRSDASKNKLLKRLAKLEQKLHLPNVLNKSAVMTTLLMAGMIFTVQEAKSQIFADPVINPFGLSTIPSPYGFLGSPVLADIDNDGDMDMFLGSKNGHILFYENTGTSDHPVFSTYLINPFGLAFTGSYSFPDLADLDNDGDLDMLTGGFLTETYYYYENTGTVSTPVFAPPVNNPFGLGSYVPFSPSPEFVDLDNDGDYDMLTGALYNYIGLPFYYENTGSAESPLFAFPEQGAFGLNGAFCGSDYYSNYAIGDYDHDGDFDLVGGFYYDPLCFIENTGTATSPYFDNDTIEIPYLPVHSARPCLGDMDDDGDIDLLVVNGGPPRDYYYYENTGCNLIVPDSLFVSGIAGTSATLNWSPDDPNYQFGVQVYDITTATVVKKIITADHATTVTGLSAGHNYGWKVWTVCPDFKTRRGPSETGYFSIPMRAGIFPTADLIYPNPSSGTITIHLEGLNSENRILNIYNMTGELINQMQLPDELINISVDTELPAVQYLMIVRDDANSISQLIIITR